MRDRFRASSRLPRVFRICQFSVPSTYYNYISSARIVLSTSSESACPEGTYQSRTMASKFIASRSRHQDRPRENGGPEVDSTHDHDSTDADFECVYVCIYMHMPAAEMTVSIVTIHWTCLGIHTSHDARSSRHGQELPC